ncbi:MAG: hypothetical protein V3S07_06665, partial [Micropepsaceae bacterium]
GGLRCSDMRKIISIAAVNTLYGALLGGFAAAETTRLGAGLGLVFGCVMGMMTSLVVVTCVHRKPLFPACTIIYALTFLVTALATFARLPGFVMLVSIGALCLYSVCVKLFLADAQARIEPRNYLI